MQKMSSALFVSCLVSADKDASGSPLVMDRAEHPDGGTGCNTLVGGRPQTARGMHSTSWPVLGPVPP